ncbi:hypothetical protein [Actinopolymorpha alba]|uniref:hypothetical protein n=1 Tax=Actinopolymorpha alba TaxID=533267 RepID=UPI000377C216|nr:hypothetical protein [Actinopolymorpha alba]
MTQAESLGRETACEDGTPVVHDDGRCVWCGLSWNQHENPAEVEPTRQAEHRLTTGVQVEAEFIVWAEAKRHLPGPEFDA